MPEKILHLYKDYYPILGGIENHIRTVAEAQAEAGYDVSVLVHSLDARTRYEEMGGVRIIKAGRLATLASTPMGVAMPWQLSRQRPDLIHLHFPYPWGEVSNLLCGRAPRMVITYHSDVVKQQRLLKWYRPLLLQTLRKADRIIATSPRYIETSPFLNQLPDRCSVIPLGVDLTRFQHIDPARVERIRSRFAGPLLLFVGRLRYYKGLHYLVEAMADLSATLLVVGEGPMGDVWRQLVSDRRLDDRIHFLSSIGDDELPAYYQACDLFVLPASQRSEAFGTVLLEAMACGKALITTELGTGTSWVNQHGETGLVTPAADPPALADAIRQLLNDDTLRSRMGRASRRRVEAEFTDAVMLERIEALYRDLF